MRIVNKKEFMKLPDGTLYSDYDPSVFNGLFVKCETFEHDFIQKSLLCPILASSSVEESEILYDAETKGKSFDLDYDATERNGEFFEEGLFAVYEQKDIEGLISELYECLKIVKK